jgi:hypothetical protein
MSGIMKRIAMMVLIGSLVSCANDEQAITDSTQTVEKVSDTNHLISDSVEVPDTNTADIEVMKKRN